MSAAQVDVNRDSFGHVYMWSLVIAGAAIVLGSIYELQLPASTQPSSFFA